MLQAETPNDQVVLELKIPRESEETPERMAGVFSALANIKGPIFERILGRDKPLIFEIANFDQVIHFYAVLPVEYQTYFESQLAAQYPKATIISVPDYLEKWSEGNLTPSVCQLKLASPFYYPLKTYVDFKDTDPLSSVLGALARAEKEEKMLVQILVRYVGRGWQASAAGVIRKGTVSLAADGTKTTSPHPQATLIETKMSQLGLKCAIRLLVYSPDKVRGEAILKHLAGSFGGLASAEGNALIISKPQFWQEKGLLKAILRRRPSFFPGNQILNASELATIYHFPSKLLSGIRNISWGNRLAGEPPENLPTALGAGSEEEKQQINFFARTEFKNKVVTFGIKKKDRRKHIYIIGKTGTGKSTLIANMAINDMRNREGMAVIDPHGDLSETLLDFVPSYRLNDVCYLDPADTGRPFHLNFLETKNPEQQELIASGIVAIFYKLYYYSWGPRMEYIFRNALLTIFAKPDATLVDIPRLLTDRSFRGKVLEKLDDPVLQSFWKEEYDAMSEKMLTESISPILNKVGQFVQSPMIRGIIGYPRSTIDLEDIMDNGKILLLNLSSGRLGEDTSALLGAMFISKIQLAAMNRVNVPEEQRKDFYLYVDEFQNFATTSFIKILSEARKYRLNLTLANQYIAQVPEEIQKAIFGNVGTLVSFLIGAQDSTAIAKEFAQVYEDKDLVSLGNFQIITKLSIDNLTSRPFYASTLPLPRCINQNREKVIRLSKERYTKPVNK